MAYPDKNMTGKIHLSHLENRWELIIDNPGKANCLNHAMLLEFENAIQIIEKHNNLKPVILRSSSTELFCSGADIRDWSQLSPEEFGRDWIDKNNKLFQRFELLNSLTVCLISGPCLGGGLELALCCDVRIATPQSLFAFPEVKIGAFPGWMGVARLEKMIGTARAKQMAMFGDPIDATQALSWGLVNYLYEKEHLNPELLSIMNKLQTRSRQSISAIKGVFSSKDLFEYHAAAATNLRRTHDASEGVAAFLERRSPNFFK